MFLWIKHKQKMAIIYNGPQFFYLILAKIRKDWRDWDMLRFNYRGRTHTALQRLTETSA